MKDALKQHEGTVTTGGRTITSPHFYIHVFEGKERKLSSLVEPLGKEASAFGMDIRKRKG